MAQERVENSGMERLNLRAERFYNRTFGFFGLGPTIGINDTTVASIPLALAAIAAVAYASETAEY
jgi:hypothetical protein